MKLSRLVLKDFLSHEDSDIKFDRTGIYSIQGYNEHSGDSNGSGKSSIISAISWVLYNRTPSGLIGKDVVRWGQKNCTVILETYDDLHRYIIRRSVDQLEVYIDGQKQPGNKKDLQILIEAIFGDYQTFMTFALFTRYWSKFFTEVGDADRKKLFKEILQLQKLDQAYNKAKEIHSVLSIQATKTEENIKFLTSRKEDLEKNIEKYEKILNDTESYKDTKKKEIKEKLERSKPNIVDYDQEIQSINQKIQALTHGDNREFEDRMQSLLSDLNAQFTKLNGMVFNLQMEIKKYDEKIKQFASMGGVCPACQQEVPVKYRHIHKRELEVTKNQYLTEYDEVLKKKDEIQIQLTNTQETLNNYKNLLSRLKELELLKEKQKSDIARYEELKRASKEAMKTIDKMISDYTELLTSYREDLEKIKTELARKQTLFSSLTQDIDIFNYLIWLFSRQGVISAVVERALLRLKFLANKILAQVTPEPFKINILTKKMLKSGDVRDEIEITIVYNNITMPYLALSAGQQQKINIAFLFALYFWGREMGKNPYDFILLDEILDLSLASKGQEDVVNMLKLIKDKISHILIISHKEILSGNFDKEIFVVRDSRGISMVKEG